MTKIWEHGERERKGHEYERENRVVEPEVFPLPVSRPFQRPHADAYTGSSNEGQDESRCAIHWYSPIRWLDSLIAGSSLSGRWFMGSGYGMHWIVPGDSSFLVEVAPSGCQPNSAY